MEWGEDSLDGHAVMSAPAAAAVAAPNKGRFNKRKFGSPLPSRPASAVFFSTAPANVPASAEVAAAAASQESVTTESALAPSSRSRKRGANSQVSLAPDSAPAPSKYAKVTPEVPSAGTVRDELYWQTGTGDIAAGEVSEMEMQKEASDKAVKGKAATKVATVATVVAGPVRRSARGAK
jgi:hypothetical protein